MDLDELRAFVAVAETLSMSKAARSLGFARATFQRRIDELEARVGAPLLERNTKGVRLTAAGELLARRGRVVLEETSLLLSQVRSLSDDPEGMLHVLIPLGLAAPALATAFELLAQLLPGLSFEVRYAADPVAMVLERVDVVGFFAAPGENRLGPSWICYELAKAPQRLLASASYLKAHGTPDSAGALASHRLLLWQPPGPPVRRATIDGKVVDVEPLVISAQVEHLLAMASRGLGIACVPEGGLDLAYLGPDRLVPVLPDTVGPSFVFTIAVPRALADLPKVRTFIRVAEQALRGHTLV